MSVKSLVEVLCLWKSCIKPDKLPAHMPSLHPGSFEVSSLLCEEGNWLFVCLLKRWQFPPRTENCIHLSLSLALSLSQVDCDSKTLLEWSASHIYVLHSEALVSHLSICWHHVSRYLSCLIPALIQFDPRWDKMDPIPFVCEQVACQTAYGTYESWCTVCTKTLYMESSIWGTDWTCVASLQTGSAFFSYDGHWRWNIFSQNVGAA